MTKQTNTGGIGTRNEGSLHAALKEWYALPGDMFEVAKDGYIIDIVRNDLLIEIQTSNFAAIKKKLTQLLKEHRIRLIYPISKDKWIVVYSQNGKDVIRRRKSPKTGELLDIFSELVRIPTLINHPNLSIEVLLTQEEEIRCNDGQGSWRRQGISIVDRRLISVMESVEFSTRDDFAQFIPDQIGQPFTTKSLAHELKIPVAKARRMAYCLKRMQVIEEVGKKGNSLLYEISKL